jgi:cellulose synthase/poly-beta-1,6-N-acetylglucosamine synthase-like glycosyltransferase
MNKAKIIAYGAIIIVLFALLHMWFPYTSWVKTGIDGLFTNFAANWAYLFLFIGLIFWFGLILYYGITYFGLLEGYRPPKEFFFPNISIIITSKDEAPLLKQTLDSIVASDYPKDKMQVIIVTSGSSDGSEVFCEKYAAEHSDVDWKVVHEVIAKKGKPPALNVGLKYVKHDFLVLYDAGNILLPDTIKNLIAPLKNEKVHATIGSIRVKNWDKNRLTKSIFLDYVIVSGGNTFFEAKNKMGTNCYIYGRNFCVRTAILREIGGFNEESLTEDMYLAAMMNIRGKKILFTPFAKMYEPVPTVWNIVQKQRMRWVGGFIGDMPKIVKIKEGEKPVGKKVIISRFLSMQLLSNVAIWFLIDAIVLVLHILFADYYMATWDVIFCALMWGFMIHSVRNFGDKHYSTLWYYPFLLKLHLFMFSLSGKLPKQISWEQTPQLLLMSKEELTELTESTKAT